MSTETVTDAEPADDFVFPNRDTNTEQSDELACEVCGKPLTYAGRGRKPKRCDDCKPTRTTGTTRKRSVDALTKELEATLTDIGALVQLADVFDGQCIIQGSPRLASSLGNVADKNATVRKTLESFVGASAWGGVVASAAAIAVPILMHHGILPTPTTPHREPPTEQARTFSQASDDAV